MICMLFEAMPAKWLYLENVLAGYEDMKIIYAEQMKITAMFTYAATFL